MRALMIVQLVDEHEWLRAFIVMWIRALAAQVERLDVITLELGEADLPDNVFVQSMGKEKGYGRVRMLWAFHRAMLRVVHDVDVIFSHLTPRYTWLAAPYAARFHKPQMLWYTHRQISVELRLALACVRWIVTATTNSFPIKNPKVQVMGHGIDADLFAPGDPPPDDPSLVLAVGRIAPIKHYHTLLEVAALLQTQHRDVPVRFAIAGAPAAPGDDAYYTALLQRRDTLGLTDEQFTFLGALAPADLLMFYRRAALVVNLTAAGSFDKAALEAMLTTTPLVTSNAAFEPLLATHRDQLMVTGPDDTAGIATRIADLLALAPGQRATIGHDLRERTQIEHGLDRLMTRLVALVQEQNTP